MMAIVMAMTKVVIAIVAGATTVVTAMVEMGSSGGSSGSSYNVGACAGRYWCS